MQSPPALSLSAPDALRWQVDMGIVECMESTPQMPWNAQPATIYAAPSNAKNTSDAAEFNQPSAPAYEAAPKPSPRGRLAPESLAPTLATAIAQARELADAASDLSTLESSVRSFNDCGLKKTATNTVFAQGIAESRVMFIGEAPGADEDRQGVPFCGVSGQLLDKMLSFIGLKRAENFYITNTLFWRPPGNRQPTPEELAICRPFVEKHIALVNPKMLILVGGTATQSILGDTRGITRLRGQKFNYTNAYMQAPVPVSVIYHPSYLLRQPMAKKQTWTDLLALKKTLSA